MNTRESTAETVERRKIVKLDDFDAYVQAEIITVDGFRSLRINASQRVDPTVSAGFSLQGSDDAKRTAQSLRALAELFNTLAQELAR